MTKWYRYEESWTSQKNGINPEWLPEHEKGVHLHEFQVLKETPRCMWIVAYNKAGKRLVSKTAVKRYAYPTKEEALDNFVHRKKSHLAHVRAKNDEIMRLLGMVKSSGKYKGDIGESIVILDCFR